MENSKKTVTVKQGPLTVAILCTLIYLFGGFPIIYVFAHIVRNLEIVDFPIDLTKLDSSYVASILQIVLTSALTYFLIKRYGTYLFSHYWKTCFGKYLVVGLKWSIPIIILHAISLSIPSVRNKIVAHYLTVNGAPLQDLSKVIFILFSVRILICAIFEELISRGIIQQKLEKFFSPTLSVFVAAGFFALAHCIYYDIETGTIVSAYFLGLLCGFAFKRTRSCLSAIVPHIVTNSGAIVLVLVIQREIPF